MLQEIHNSVSLLFTKKAIWAMADALDENKGDLSDALEHIIAALVNGVADSAAGSGDMAARLFSAATDANSSGWWRQTADHISGAQSTEQSMGLLKMIFGHEQLQQKADSLAAQNHIKPSSVLSLMQWAVPACFGVLGEYVAAHNLSVDSFAAGLSNTLPGKPVQLSEEPQVRGKMRFFWPLLLLLIGFAVWWFLKMRNDAAEQTIKADGTIHSVAEKAGDPKTGMRAVATVSFRLNEDSTLSYSLGDTIAKELPDGTVLHVPAGSAEAQLISKIQDAMKNGPDTSAEGKASSWINLYNVQFSQMLDYRSGAVQQIRNIAAILKAYPGVVIKLGGYTDNTGVADVNKKLSQRRAEKVAASLYTAGAGAQVENAEGYGPDFPVADNATPEGRAQNRRVACRIISVKK